MEMGQFYYRMDNFLMMLAGEPERAHRFLDVLVEIHLRRPRKISRGGGRFDRHHLLWRRSGAQNGPQISPRMYREFFKPRHAMMWERAKELAPVKVMLHCCGAVRPLMPDLIDAGLDAINPVQISCRGMEAEGLKRDFGKDLAFWGGGCDTQWMLPRGYARRGASARAGAVRSDGAGRRICLPAGAQHLGDVPAGTSLRCMPQYGSTTRG